MKKIMTREVVDTVSNYLGGCPDKVISRYIGVSAVWLSKNIEKPFSEILENKVGKRLDALLYLLECARKDETIDASNIHRLLTLPAFVDKDGWKVDVVSAIHAEYDKGMLIEIFQRALESLRKPLDKVPVADGLYNAIHA